MRTVNELAKLVGVSVRTLHHYDAIGLLKPAKVTESGYRLYDDASLEKLHLILLFRELDFPLNQISEILNAPDFDRNKILDRQIALLRRRREHLDRLIFLAQQIQQKGVNDLDFTEFDAGQPDQAKILWGKTDAYREFEEKHAGRSTGEEQVLVNALMGHFCRLGKLRSETADSPAVQHWVRELQDFITDHYYTCTIPILQNLGQMYAAGGSMTENIDRAGGSGTGEFAARAIAIYCANR